MRTARAVFTTIALLVTTPAIWAQSQAPHQHGGQTAQQPAGQTADSCHTMMQQRQQMMQEMQQKDEQLQQKVNAMNSAQGDAKLQAMSEIITELVSQRREMHDKMSQMHANEMTHMAGHMSSGQGTKGMMSCPMMQQGGQMHGSTTSPTPQGGEQERKPVE